ncbi:MAG: hypothetical protein KC506_03090 [Nanoarchaeota archaeon]|nr:hypothetical protein [Nanoarchaeota archaeon]
MYKSRILRGGAKKYILPILKKLNVRPEVLVLFRVLFAIVTGTLIIYSDFKTAIIFVTLYQVVFLLDYVDGDLAKHQECFSIRWNLIDRGLHHITSAFLFLAVVLAYVPKGIFSQVGLIGFSFILLNLIIEQVGMLGSKVALDDLRGEPGKQGAISAIYSFLPIDGPFTIFYILLLCKLFVSIIVFYTALYTIILIKKIFKIALK